MKYKRIFIHGNRRKRGCHAACVEAAAYLKDKAHIVAVDFKKDCVLPKSKIDLVISFGGDGSLLHLTPQVLKRNIPIMGINFGRMGFLTSGLAADMTSVLNQLIAGKLEPISLMVLDVVHYRGRKIHHRSLAVNDAVICNEDLSRVFSIDAKVTSEFLFHLRGDGLIISTPTGSTAHSLSAGGAIVDSRMEAVQLTPLGPQSLSSRPIVVSPDEVISITIRQNDINAMVMTDGQFLSHFRKDDELKVSRSKKKLQVLQPRDFRFFRRLREKLGWNQFPLSAS